MKVQVTLIGNTGQVTHITKDFTGRTRMGNPFSFRNAVADITQNHILYDDNQDIAYPLENGYYKVAYIEQVK